MKTFSLILPVLFGMSNFSPTAGYEVCYSPKGGCKEMIERFIDSASPGESILLMAYVLTSDPISDALIRANNRGAKVTAIIDRNAAKTRGADAKRLKDAGVEVLVDKKHPISHSKTIIIGDAVQTGSFNYSTAAETVNQENAIILYSVPDIAGKYKEFFEFHRLHSKDLK